MNKSLFLLLVLLLTGCASFQVSTLNHDPIYAIEGSDAEITVIDNEFELRRLLRTDFNFRYDFAQYAQTLPITWHYSNRFMGFNRYNRFNNYSSFYYSYSNRHQMWNDWVWGYNWYSPHPMSSFSNNWGSYQYYSWNNYGWNNRYRRGDVVYHNNRRSNVNQQNRRAHASMIQSTIRNKVVKTIPRKVITTKPRRVIKNINNSNIRTKPVRRTRTVIPSVRVNTPTRTTRVVSNRTQPARKVNSRRKN